MTIISSVLVGVALAVLSNVVSNSVYPAFDKRRRFAWSLFVGLIALSISLPLLTNAIDDSSVKALPNSIIEARGLALFCLPKNPQIVYTIAD